MKFSYLRPVAARVSVWCLVFGSMVGLVSGCDGGSSAAGTSAGGNPTNVGMLQTPSTAATAAPVSLPTVPAMSGAAGATSAPSVSGTPSSGPGTPGGTCVAGDRNHLCLAIHFVAYTDANGQPVATPDQAATIIQTMNKLWSQCDIGFQIEKYETADPAQFGLAYGGAAENELDQIRAAFSTSNDQLLAVTTGPWNTATNAWTAMPGGSGPHGAIMEQGIVDYYSGIIYAHEFGHYLGLSHVPDQAELMDAIIYSSSTLISAADCQTARQSATSDWAGMLRN